jgi:hypothetical protein
VISGIRILLLALLCLSASALYAQTPGAGDISPEELIGQRPAEQGKPVEVTVRLHIFDIFSIDDVQQNFKADLFAQVMWLDPRLAVPEGQRRGLLRTLSLDSIWVPRALVVNDRGLELQLPRVANVDDLGNVRMQQRLSGAISHSPELAEFPFDTQALSIDVVSYQYLPDEVVFTIESEITGEPGKFNAKGWDFALLEPVVGIFRVPSVGAERPLIQFRVEARRISRYFVLTMFLPMSLIVFMAWTAFWIQPELVPPRIAISTASIFSLIAFGFSIRLGLPQVSYLTRSDMFVLGCTLLVFVALGVAVIGSRWANAERLERAVRLNAYARWLYVFSFGAVVLAALYA